MSKLMSCLSGAVVVLASTSGASAQSGGGSVTGLELEEVVVTATKRATDLQKTPISIQTYSGEELKQQGKRRIDEIMNGVVGVTVQTSQVGSNFYMRGVEASTNGTPTVAVLIDGVYQVRGEAVRGGTLDVGQVEVMRGTQSTNLGASALAGAVSLVSNQPVFEYQANGSLEAGNYHLLNMEGVLNVPLSDNQAVRFAYSSNKRDGYISSGAGDTDLQNARLKYRWQVSEALDTVLTVSHNSIGGNGVSDGVLLATGHWVPYDATYFSSPTGGATALAAGSCVATLGMGTTNGTVTGTMGCPPQFMSIRDGINYFQRSNPWDDGFPKDAWPNHPYRHTNIDQYSADINWTTPIGTLTATPSVQRSTFKSTEPPRGSWRVENRKQDTNQLDLRLASAPDATLQWLAGLYYFDTTGTTGTFLTILPPGSVAGGPGTVACPPVAGVGNYCYNWTDTRDASTLSESAYANFTYPVLEGLRLNGGLRYSRDEKEALAATANNLGTIAAPATPFVYNASGKGEWHATTYRAGVEYDVLSQSMLYGSYATGYQPGAIDTMGATAVVGAPQKLQQITVGMKNRFFDNKLQLNVEAFNSVYKDRPLTLGTTVTDTIAATATPCNAVSAQAYRANINTTTATAGCLNFNGSPTIDATSRGVDVEINFLPTSNDRLDLSVEWLESSYRSLPTLTTQLGSVDEVLSYAGITPAAATTLQRAIATSLYSSFTSNVNGYQDQVLQNAPSWAVNASFQHEFQFAGGSKLTPRVNGYYKSRYWTTGGGPAPAIQVINDALKNGKGHYDASGAVSLPIQPSYSLFDAYLTWQNADGKFTVASYIKNIEGEPVIQNASTTAVTLGAPRTYGVIFSADF